MSEGKKNGGTPREAVLEAGQFELGVEPVGRLAELALRLEADGPQRVAVAEVARQVADAGAGVHHVPAAGGRRRQGAAGAQAHDLVLLLHLVVSTLLTTGPTLKKKV